MLLFYVTHPDEATAQRIADKLLQQKLIACANIFPITSAYWWQNAIQKEGEWVSLLKTQPQLADAVEQAVRAAHPYQTPCLLRMEVQANADYEDWIRTSTETA